MKRKTDTRNEMKLQELRAKAVRRGDKLVNTLRKLAAKDHSIDPSVEPLLKKLEQVLPRLRRLFVEHDSPPSNRDGRRVEKSSRKAGTEPHFPLKVRSRRAKRQQTPASVTE